MNGCPTTSTPTSSRLDRLIRRYQVTATLLLNTVIVFVVVNMIALGGLIAADAFAPERNVVEDKYGSGALAQVYPGMAEADIRELLGETWRQHRVFQPYVQFRESPFRGRYVNVHDAGFRHSADQAPWPPPADTFSVFFFGGSTTFAYGLPDGDTVPSQVQQLLRGRGYAHVAVHNFGAGSYQSTQERIFFGELLARGTRPDMAIFLDGLNDFAFPHVPQDTDLVVRALENVGAGSARRLYGLVSAMPISRAARALLPSTLDAPASGARKTEAAADAALIDSVVTRYLANVTQTGGAARASGVIPIFIWQPTPYYRYDTSRHPFVDSGGVNRHAAEGYAHARTRFNGRTVDPAFLWAADIQEGVSEPLYVDSMHYTRAMSGRLARWIVDQLPDVGLVPRRN